MRDERNTVNSCPGTKSPLLLTLKRPRKVMFMVKAGQPVDDLIAECLPFLEKGDVIYVFSDGYPDQFGGPKGKKFMYKPFREMLLSIHEKPMDEQHKLLFNSFIQWRGEIEQIDDVCVIGVRV